MIYISAGTDTYGGVKVVAGTRIVTKFAMLQFFPLFPLQSFYFVSKGKTGSEGIPFLASSQSSAIFGIPLSNLDTTSVIMAYIRGLFGAMTVIGFLVIFPAIMYLTGENLDEIAITAARALMTSLLVGTVGGLLTYALRFTPRRERAIRKYCGEILGISADPARVTIEASESLARYAEEQALAAKNERARYVCELIAARTMISQSNQVARMEMKTDELLEQLRRSDHLSV